jgi:uncharacterized phage infection (PIP) family protein YhgE
VTDREMLAAIMAKLEGLEEGQQQLKNEVGILKEGQQQLKNKVGTLTEKVDKLATDMDQQITGLYRYVSEEMAGIREQLTRMEAKQNKTAETVGYVIQDVYLLQKKTGVGSK